MSESSLAELMARQATAVDWVAAACITCLLYDHILTLGEEWSNMWPARWTFPKVLFYLNRYLVEAMLLFDSVASSRSHLSLPFCVFYLRWLTCMTTITFAVVEAILVIRVWALYRTNKPVLFLAAFFYLGGVFTLLGLTIQDYVGETVSAVDDFNVLPGCYANSVPSMIAGYWIAPVIIESLLFALIIIRTFTWWKDRRSIPHTLILLARESTIYFAVIFALLIANLFVFEYGPPFLSSLMVTPSNTAGCLAGSRMLLNLRSLADPTPTHCEMSIPSFASPSTLSKGTDRSKGANKHTLTFEDEH